jgi:hypothetical protein
MANKHKAFANVPMSEGEQKAYQQSEEFWTGPRLVALTAGTLGVALVVLYLMAQVTSETTWSDWLIPG